MVAGPAVVKELFKSAPQTAKKIKQGLLDIITEGKGKGNFQQVSSKIPGLFKGDVYTQPATRELYSNTGVLPMPYSVPNPLTGRPQLEYGIDIGRAYAKPGILDQVSDLLSKGEKVRMSDIIEVPGRGLMDAAYGPTWLDNIVLSLNKKGVRNATTLGAGSATYKPFSHYWGNVELENIDTLDPRNTGFLDAFLNHEVNHLTMALGGLPAGSSAKAFDPDIGSKFARLPVGMENIGARKLYLSDLGEDFSKAPLDTNNLFGTRLPVTVRSRLEHPIPGQDYSFGHDHLGMDVRDYLAKAQQSWDDIQKWRGTK